MSDYIPELASDKYLPAWTQPKAVNSRQVATFNASHSCWFFDGCTNMITSARSCSWQKMEKHYLQHFDKEFAYHYCKNCDKKFTTKDHVNTHFKGTNHAPARPECREETRFRCPAPKCGKSFDWNKETEFYDHIAAAHGRCYLCREIIPNEKTLDSHIQEHKDEFQKRKKLARKAASSSSSKDTQVNDEQCRGWSKRNRDRESIINGKRPEKGRKISTPSAANQQAEYVAEKEAGNVAKLEAENTRHIQGGHVMYDTDTSRMGSTSSDTEMSTLSSNEKFPRCFSNPLHSFPKAEYDEIVENDAFEMSPNTMTMSRENSLQQKDDFSVISPFFSPTDDGPLSSYDDTHAYNEQYRSLRKRNRDRELIINGKRPEKGRKISTANVVDQPAEYVAEKEGEIVAKMEAENTENIQNGHIMHDTETSRMGPTSSDTEMPAPSAEKFPRCFSIPLHPSPKTEYDEMVGHNVFGMSSNTMPMSCENTLQQKDGFSMLSPSPFSIFPQIDGDPLSISDERHEMCTPYFPDLVMNEPPIMFFVCFQKLEEHDEEFPEPGGVPTPKPLMQGSQPKTQQPAVQQTKSLVHSDIQEISPSNFAQGGNLNPGQSLGNGNAALGVDTTPFDTDNIPRLSDLESMDASELSDDVTENGLYKNVEEFGDQKIGYIFVGSDFGGAEWKGLRPTMRDLVGHYLGQPPVSQDLELTSTLKSINDHRDSKLDGKKPIEKIPDGALQSQPEISQWIDSDTEGTSGETVDGDTNVPILGSVHPQRDFDGFYSSSTVPWTSGFGTFPRSMRCERNHEMKYFLENGKDHKRKCCLGEISPDLLCEREQRTGEKYYGCFKDGCKVYVCPRCADMLTSLTF